MKRATSLLFVLALVGCLSAPNADLRVPPPQSVQSTKPVNVDRTDARGLTPLMIAARDGDLDQVVDLLDRGANPNFRNPQSLATPLFFAVSRKGNIAVVRELIARGAKVNVANAIRSTPLHFAADYQSTYVLLEAGAEPGPVDDFGQAATFGPVYRGDFEATKLLLDNLSGIGHPQDREGKTLLMYAAEQGHYEIARLLLSYDWIRSSIDYKDKEGKTALMYAASKAIGEIVSILLKEGASVNYDDSSGRTALMYASFYDLAIVKKLVESGANINARDQYGGNALHDAIFAKKWDICDYLISAEIDTTIVDRNGSTLLFETALNLNPDLSVRLISTGVDVSHKNTSGSTALGWALSTHKTKPNTDLLKYAVVLIEHGADVNTTDSDGRTVLMVAARLGAVDYVSRLISLGADLALVDRAGNDCFFYASDKPTEELLKAASINNK